MTLAPIIDSYGKESMFGVPLGAPPSCLHRPVDEQCLPVLCIPHLILSQHAPSLLTQQTHVLCVCSWMLFHILLEYFVYCYIIKLEGTLVECELAIWPKDHQRSTNLLMIMYNWLIAQNSLDFAYIKLNNIWKQYLCLILFLSVCLQRPSN